MKKTKALELFEDMALFGLVIYNSETGEKVAGYGDLFKDDLSDSEVEVVFNKDGSFTVKDDPKS